jgi:hypothetical protein
LAGHVREVATNLALIPTDQPQPEVVLAFTFLAFSIFSLSVGAKFEEVLTKKHSITDSIAL